MLKFYVMKVFFTLVGAVTIYIGFILNDEMRKYIRASSFDEDDDGDVGFFLTFLFMFLPEKTYKKMRLLCSKISFILIGLLFFIFGIMLRK